MTVSRQLKNVSLYTTANLTEMSKHSSTSHVPAILSAGLLPLMIATRSMPDFSTTLRESDSITPEQVAALDRCRMFESMFGLEKMPRKQLVKHVRDYVEHLKDAHANAGIHTKHQWKQLRRCLKGNSYCRKEPDLFMRYAMQEAVKAARHDGTGLIVSKPQVIVTSLEIMPTSDMDGYMSDSSSSDVPTDDEDDATWHEVKFGSADESSSDDIDEYSDEYSVHSMDDDIPSIASSSADTPALSRRQKMKMIVDALEDALIQDGAETDETGSEVVI